MITRTLTFSFAAALAVTLLSPTACTQATEARPAVQQDSTESSDSVRTVRRHSSDIDRRKAVKPDRPQNQQDVKEKGQKFHPDHERSATDQLPNEEDEQPRTAEATVEIPEFWVWVPTNGNRPVTEFEFWHLENVFPLVRALVDVPFSHGYNAPGKPLPQRRFNPDGSPVAVDPLASAQQMYNYIEWHREDLIAKGRSNLKYAIWPQNWGARHHHNPSLELNNIFALGGNPRDKLTQPGIVDNAQYEAFYASEGIALNRQWSASFVARLDQLLRQNAIEPPAALHFDLEGVFMNRKAMKWWTYALDDPRANSELIDGIYTMAEIEAQAPNYDPTREIWRPVNRKMMAYVHSVSQRALDYALWEGFWKQARMAWPSVELSNYGLYGASNDVPVPTERIGAEIKRAPLRFADYAAPVVYGFPHYAINPHETIPAQLERFGGSATGDEAVDLRRLTVLYQKARLSALASSGTPISPWICSPEHANIQFEDTIEIMKFGTDLGIRDWILWSSHPYDWSDIVKEITDYVDNGNHDQD